MGFRRDKTILIALVLSMLFYLSCSNQPGGTLSKTDRKPGIMPDYTDVTIPPNIAPMKLFSHGGWYLLQGYCHIGFERLPNKNNFF